jgi:hypothetical protein
MNTDDADVPSEIRVLRNALIQLQDTHASNREIKGKE